jgi:hypothetical protein
MMKTIILIVFSIALSALGEEEYRTFTDAEGREIKAKVLKVDPRSGQVTVERDNQRRVTVAPTVFSKSDQAYIKEWQATQAFMSNSKLRISVERKKGQKPSDGSEEKKPKTPVYFEVELENRSGAVIDQVGLSYTIYVGGGRLGVGGSLSGKTESFSLAPKEKKVVTSKTAQPYVYSVISRDPYTDYFGNLMYETSVKKQGEDDVEGIKVRVSMKMKSGNVFTRDIFRPETLAKKYREPQTGRSDFAVRLGRHGEE